MTIDTHGLVCDFGKHDGTLYTRMPVSYLLWMVNVNHSRADIAKAELDRRGTTVPTLDVSGHAIDRASLRLNRTWRETRKKDEGLHSWLVRKAQDALDNGLELKADDDTKTMQHLSAKWVFQRGAWPVLKTVMPA